jgi:thymidylate synthase ThyX
MHTLITATEWDNFFELRDHQDAQPEFRELAKKIREAMERYPLQRLGSTDWHLPYIRVEEKKGKTEGDLLKMSSARCARVSYLNHDSVSPTLEEDSRLFERLVGSSPMHASPVEHQALPAQTGYRSGNFIGWKQYRQVLLATKPDAKNLQEVVDGSGF